MKIAAIISHRRRASTTTLLERIAAAARARLRARNPDAHRAADLTPEAYDADTD